MLYKGITSVTKYNELYLDSDIIDIDTKFHFIALLIYKKMLRKRIKSGEIQRFDYPVILTLDEYIENVEKDRWWLDYEVQE